MKSLFQTLIKHLVWILFWKLNNCICEKLVNLNFVNSLVQKLSCSWNQSCVLLFLYLISDSGYEHSLSDSALSSEHSCSLHDIVYACGAREGPCYQSYYNKQTRHITWHISVAVIYSYQPLKWGFIQDFRQGGHKRRLPNEEGQGQ